MRSLKDKAVLITGAGRGIGKRLALGFAAAGARVGLLARSKAELDLAHLEIEHAGGISLRIRADVREYDQVCAAVDRMRAHYGGVDILIAAAGTQGPVGPLADTPPKAWLEAVETNLLGVMHCCRAVLPQMIDRRSGKILVLTGGVAGHAVPNFSAYAASKAAVVRLVETVAEEVAEHNVQINCISPGRTYTHMTDQVLRAGDRAGHKAHEEALRVRLTGGTPPEKQIELALFLAHEDSNHVNGKLLHVDDNWRRLQTSSLHPEAYTLRRVHRT